jgi:hypothetical protein
MPSCRKRGFSTAAVPDADKIQTSSLEEKRCHKLGLAGNILCEILNTKMIKRVTNQTLLQIKYHYLGQKIELRLLKWRGQQFFIN